MKLQPRVKICGITSPHDAEIAAASGADAIGLVFYPNSPRVVDIKRASAIVDAVGPFVTVVALFVNARVEEVKRVVGEVAIQCLQFHGNEDPDFCQQFLLPYLKAVKVPSIEFDRELADNQSLDNQSPDEEKIDNKLVGEEKKVTFIQQQVIKESQVHAQAAAILLDTFHPRQQGGTGKQFDWRCVPQSNTHRWILAGGLNPANVADAVTQTNPYAVDVSSGVESSPGVKDRDKIRQFIINVQTQAL